jgi:hypothetical protein
VSMRMRHGFVASRLSAPVGGSIALQKRHFSFARN